MLLPRSNPAAVKDIDIGLIKSGEGYVKNTKYANRIAIKIGNGAHVSLVEQEVDDLIVMLTYYQREVFGEA